MTILTIISLILSSIGDPTAGDYQFGNPSGASSCLIQSCQTHDYGTIFNLSLDTSSNVYDNKVCSLDSCSSSSSNRINCYICHSQHKYLDGKIQYNE